MGAVWPVHRRVEGMVEALRMVQETAFTQSFPVQACSFKAYMD